MNKSYVPDWATHYTISRHGCSYGATLRFYCSTMAHSTEVKFYPISELAHDLAIADVCQQIKDKPLEARMVPHNKYSREIKPNVWVDVYDTLAAFTGDVSSRIKPAVDHAIKKLLAPGKRGVKDERQDLVEARDSLDRAIQLIDDLV